MTVKTDVKIIDDNPFRFVSHKTRRRYYHTISRRVTTTYKYRSTRSSFYQVGTPHHATPRNMATQKRLPSRPTWLQKNVGFLCLLVSSFVVSLHYIFNVEGARAFLLLSHQLSESAVEALRDQQTSGLLKSSDGRPVRNATRHLPLTYPSLLSISMYPS